MVSWALVVNMATPCVRASLSLLQPGAKEAAELGGTHALYPDRGCALKGRRKLQRIVAND